MLKGADMIVSFKIDYQTVWGEKLYVGGSAPEFGAWDPSKAIEMSNRFPGEWEVEYKGPYIPDFEYKYLLKDGRGKEVWEGGKPRILNIDENRFNEVRARDFWRTLKDPDIPLFSSAFTKVLMRRHKGEQTKPADPPERTLRIQVRVPKIDPKYKVCILGNQAVLGDWKEEEAVVMNDSAFPLWWVDIDAGKLTFPFQFKYAVYDPDSKRALIWEQGSNRVIRDFVCKSPKSIKIHTDEKFRDPFGHFRGAGVAVPVFSLRTERSGGIGEYPDIIKLVDWAKKTGLKLIQLLPLNDTVATHTWVDSYPYKSISSIALNPDYININKIGVLEDENLLIGFIQALTGFNSLETVHYEEVHKVKSKFFKFIFDQQKDLILIDPQFQRFFNGNREWLIPYAAFCFLRDKYKTAEFKNWPEFKVYHKQEIEDLCAPGTNDYPEIAIHYFIQYHAHKQLLEAAAYARENRVVLKGDIPIGISPNSVDAWTRPELFNLNQQAGAPPDNFSDLGQNWGFPTYRWDKMAEDGFSWWTKRLKHMSLYFDAIRIDHIPGFFRIWEIPADQVQGIMGHFNPALPYTRDEIMDKGILFNEERFTKPYIRDYFLWELFGEEKEEVKAKYLSEYEPGKYNLKPGFNNQRKIWDHFEKNKVGVELTGKDTRIRDGLCSLASEILFLRDPKRPSCFHPRFDFHDANSYLNIKDELRYCLDDLYIEYFFGRNEELWRQQALKILPALSRATEMLICGEDLGLLPESVSEVMKELSILSLEIQRMPKNPNDEFANPADAPYLAVCSTSTHDTSTLRGWWEEDRKLSERFFRSVLGQEGDFPSTMEPWIVREVISQHLSSPAMWTIFPIQDLLAIDAKLRCENTQGERINVPAIAQNYWRYRIHLTIDDLLEEKKFNSDIMSLVNASGRGSDS
jgi:4-alpha-glucanotransferase